MKIWPPTEIWKHTIQEHSHCIGSWPIAHMLCGLLGNGIVGVNNKLAPQFWSMFGPTKRDFIWSRSAAWTFAKLSVGSLLDNRWPLAECRGDAWRMHNAYRITMKRCFLPIIAIRLVPLIFYVFQQVSLQLYFRYGGKLFILKIYTDLEYCAISVSHFPFGYWNINKMDIIFSTKQ